MDQTQPDWTISELYSKAWNAVKKNKVLWVLGAAAAAGSGFNYRSSSNFNSSDFQKLFSPNSPNNSDTTNKITEVLGISTANPFKEHLGQIFAAVPVGWYVLGALELVTIFILAFVLQLVYRSWAQGMLIQATATALEDKNVTLADTAKQVMPKLKSLVWLFFVPGFLLALGVILGILVITAGIALTPTVGKVIFGLLGLVALGAAIYWAIMLSVSLIWAPREVLLNNKVGKESFFAGLKMGKKKFWAMALLGLVNNILAGIVFIVPIVVLIAVFAGMIFAGIKNPSSIPGLVVMGLILVIPLLIGFTLLTGIIESFKATIWTYAYTKIKGKYK